jgi:hypothetical protein
MKFIATECLGKDLQPGEVFSLEGQDFWSNRPPFAINQQVYIRTDTPLPPEWENMVCYKISTELLTAKE